MWVFFTLAGLGLAFMLYAHVQFHGEIKTTGPSTPARSDGKPVSMWQGRAIRISSKQPARRDSAKSGTRGCSHGNGEIRFRSIRSTGDVFDRRVRASAGSKFGATGKSGGPSKTR